jgi:hypothetical protein
MRVVFHFGAAKTGTKSIQEFFYTHQEDFLRQGVLYPRMPPVPAHHLLLALVQEDVTSDVVEYFGNDRSRMSAGARDAFEKVKRDVARRQPETVVLSTENVFFGTAADRYRRLKALLDELKAPIVSCCYVRAPAPYYLSLLQQVLKFRTAVLPPQPLSIRRDIEAVEEAFERPMLLRAYDRAHLAKEDVLADFVTEIVGCGLPEGSPPKRLNETMSAEAMAIALLSRRVNHPGADWTIAPEHRTMLQLLKDLDGEVPGFSKPRLWPEVAEAITRASEELLWLRDERGIVFDEIDYTTIGGSLPDSIANMREIDEICKVDHARRDVLMARLLQVGLEARVKLNRIDRIVPSDRILQAKQQLKKVMSPLRRSFRG